MSYIIQIDYSPHLAGLFKFLRRCVIGRKYHFLTGNSGFLCQNKLRQRTAVRSTSSLLDLLEQIRIRRGFDREKLPETLRPTECINKCPETLFNPTLIIYMKRSRILFNNFFYLFRSKWNLFTPVYPLKPVKEYCCFKHKNRKIRFSCKLSLLAKLANNPLPLLIRGVYCPAVS